MTIKITFKSSPEARKEIADFIIERASKIQSWKVSNRDKQKNAAVVTELLHLARQLETGEL